jgi:hypothetical protein
MQSDNAMSFGSSRPIDSALNRTRQQGNDPRSMIPKIEPPTRTIFAQSDSHPLESNFNNVNQEKMDHPSAISKPVLFSGTSPLDSSSNRGSQQRDCPPSAVSKPDSSFGPSPPLDSNRNRSGQQTKTHQVETSTTDPPNRKFIAETDSHTPESNTKKVNQKGTDEPSSSHGSGIVFPSRVDSNRNRSVEQRENFPPETSKTEPPKRRIVAESDSHVPGPNIKTVKQGGTDESSAISKRASPSFSSDRNRDIEQRDNPQSVISKTEPPQKPIVAESDSHVPESNIKQVNQGGTDAPPALSKRASGFGTFHSFDSNHTRSNDQTQPEPPKRTFSPPVESTSPNVNHQKGKKGVVGSDIRSLPTGPANPIVPPESPDGSIHFREGDILEFDDLGDIEAPDQLRMVVLRLSEEEDVPSGFDAIDIPDDELKEFPIEEVSPVECDRAEVGPPVDVIKLLSLPCVMPGSLESAHILEAFEIAD